MTRLSVFIVTNIATNIDGYIAPSTAGPADS